MKIHIQQQCDALRTQAVRYFYVLFLGAFSDDVPVASGESDPCLTLMVTLMALFMLPLYSQPCLVMPPFWDPREAVSCRRGAGRGGRGELRRGCGR